MWSCLIPFEVLVSECVIKVLLMFCYKRDIWQYIYCFIPVCLWDHPICCLSLRFDRHADLMVIVIWMCSGSPLMYGSAVVWLFLCLTPVSDGDGSTPSKHIMCFELRTWYKRKCLPKKRHKEHCWWVQHWSYIFIHTQAGLHRFSQKFSASRSKCISVKFYSLANCAPHAKLRVPPPEILTGIMKRVREQTFLTMTVFWQQYQHDNITHTLPLMLPWQHNRV